MTALQKFGTFGILTCGFYMAISKGLHSFFYDLDEARPKRLQQVEMDRQIQQAMRSGALNES